ncbi:LysR family transcriptional regulator [Rhodoplanes roseus]|uniref:HTH-type transcriptional regulator CbbR n=1 Tax=Rhodoplanes roseus TaxID=29409 RepID=A0A327LCL0_9BRAD|nr:LysR family transcriptional regulator [Rhodoplanes roseus]RAI45528.1 LysR family transcriptional regulator [Rhodoplanes roseus]
MRNVTLKHLRLLESAARLGSFTAAAEANNITPPAVTMQMRQLEQEIGLPLFDRDGRGLTPTAAGREVLLAARRIEAALAECRDALLALEGLETGRVTVGVVSTAKYFAPRMLAAFARRHPRIELQLVVGNRRDIVAQFEGGQFDVCVMGRPPEGEVESDLIGPHPHVIVAPPDHPLAGTARLQPGALAAETFLVREVGSGTRTLMEAFFAKAKLQPTIGMEIGSNETIKQAVMAGLGLAFISAHTIAAELADGRLVVLDIAGTPLLRNWYVVRPKARRLMPAAKALQAFVVAEGASFLPTPLAP